MPWSSVLSTPPPPLPSSQIARIATLAVPSLLGVDLSFSSLATKTSLPACHRAPPSFPAFKSKRPPCRVLQSNEEEVVIDEDDWILMLLRYPKSFMMMNVIQSVNYLISEGVQAKNLSGTLSPSIGNLTNLETILLQSNNISGTIPSEIGKLPKLHTLIFQTTISVEKFPSL